MLAGPRALRAQVDVLAILNDPDAPVGGNPKGDVTIVAFLDYNCPFCKKATPALVKLSPPMAASAWSTRTGRS